MIFREIPAGSIFAILFFILMFFAALTSAIALLECVVAYTIDDLHWSRRKGVLIVGIAFILLGVPSSLSFGVLKDFTILNYSFFDFVGMITDNILMPLGGIAMSIFIGWFWGPGKIIASIEEDSGTFKLKKAWLWCVRLVTPVLIVIVTIVGFVNIYNTITA